MKYYEMHEIVYRRLKENGYLSWDRETTFEKMWNHTTNIYLEKFLNKNEISFSNLKILDLGTGSGTSALFAALRGAKAIGVDISAAAIEMAKENSKQLNLDIEFFVGDVLNLNLNKKFDVIIDSTILHCIVGRDDRLKFYDTVRDHMHSESLFLINTMIASGTMDSRFPKEHFLFQDEVLWSLGMDEVTGRKIIDGKSYFPHRCLLSEDRQMKEFMNHGLEVLEIDRVHSEDGSYDLVALLKLK